MIDLDRVDIELLNIIQDEFPLTARPYFSLAERLNTSEQEIIRRLKRLKDIGIIRRIGAVFDSREMGYYSTLCACSVPAEQVERTAAIINQVRGVTHNYQRDHAWNLWFTLTVENEEKARVILRELESKIGFPIASMPAKKLYKIKVSFEMGVNDVL